MHVASLHVYPVKSLRALSVPAVSVDALGAEGDRRFIVTDPAGQFLTQRTLPRMALIEAGLDPAFLTLRAANTPPIRVPRAADPAAPLLRVRVWRSEGLLAEDCGDEAAAWLGAFLATPCRLARIGPKFHRPVDPARAWPGDAVAFNDSHPFLIIGEASLADLNGRLAARGAEPVPMNRFRPNLVVSGSLPFAEDRWTGIRIGSVEFRPAGPCTRCIVTTTDQETAERRGPEPLRTLAAYRRNPEDSTKVDFGQNFIHVTKAGNLRAGDPVEILQ